MDMQDSGSLDRRQALILMAASLGASSSLAADIYPNKVIRVIVPFATGGSSSYIARQLADGISRRLDVPVIVDNRPGANGNVGASSVARSAPDGYTLLVPSSSITLSGALYANPGFNLERDLVPITLAANIPFGLFVNSSLNVNSFREFVDWLKANQGKAAFASTGAGNVTYLSMFMLLKRLGLTATHIPYNGAAPALIDVLRGEPPVMINDLLSTREHVKSGRLKLLAVTTRSRTVASPETPTIAESGLEGFEAAGWIGVFAPAKTPGDIVQKLRDAVKAVVSSPEVQAQLVTQGTEPPAPDQHDSFPSFVASESRRWAEVIRASGAKLE